MKNTLLCLVFGMILCNCDDLSFEKNVVKSMVIHDVDLSNYTNGNYIGKFVYYGETYMVDVWVLSNRYENISVVSNPYNKYDIKSTNIIPIVLEKQTLLVDAISGATRSTKILLKSIENSFNTSNKAESAYDYTNQ